MEETKKTRKQLLQEIDELRERVAALEASEGERGRVEQKLRAGMESAQSLLEAVPEALVVIDRNHHVVLTNQAAREMMKDEDPVVRCLACHVVLHGRDVPCEDLGEQCPLTQIVATKTPATVTHKHLDQHGNEVIVEVRAAPILDEAGEVVQIVETCHDITERAQAEAALRESEERFRTLVETTQDAVIAIDRAGLITVFNPAAGQMFGRTREEMLGQPVDCLMPEELRKRHRKAREDYLAGGRPESLIGKTVELPALRSDGHVFPMELSLSAGKYGSTPFVMAVIRDITERKRAEQALRLTQFSVDRAGDAVFWLGPDAKFIYANETACMRLGYAAEELLSMTVHDIDPNFPAEVWPAHWKELKQRGTFTVESLHRARDGTLLPMEITVNHIEFEGNEYNCALARDMTERKLAQEALQKAHDELELRVDQRTTELKQSNRDLSQFAYRASHDLQQPLRMMSTFLLTLQQECRGDLDERSQKWVELSIDAGQRMQRLISDLLSYARVGTRERHFETLDTNALVDQVIADLQAMIESNGAEVNRDELPSVKADATLMMELLQNLISNAIKFHGHEPPRVHVSAESSGSEWVFSVRDNGIGIQPEYMDRVFAVFERLHSADKYPGSGIGLAICKRVVERHGGRIWCESEPGEGTTFYCSLPEAEGV